MKCGNQLSVIIVLVYVPISVCNEFVLVSLQFKPKLISHGELLRLLFKQQTKVFRGAFPKKGSFYFHKFCGPLFVPNSFCGCFSFQIHFAARWECMSFCGPLLVKNSFCGPLLVNVILRIAKIDNDPFFGNAPRFQCDQQSKLKLERRAAACRRVSKGQTQV